MIARRHVFHVAGYDPYDVAGQYRRFERELAKFAALWGVAASASALRRHDGGAASWTVTTRGPNWTVETVYEPLDWHDIVVADLARPAIPRLMQGAVTFADFIGAGLLWRYLVASHRYAFFFLVPFLDVVLFVIAGIIAGVMLTDALALGGAVCVLAAGAIAVVVFALLMRWPGRRWRVAQGLADWIFARDYMKGRRPDVEARLDQFAERVRACIHRGEADEVVIIGHSLGATLVVDLLARALARDPDLGRRGPAVAVLTVGATIPKLALHPAGARLRECAAKVAAEPSLFWVEYQARDDAISFYKFHPVTLRRIASDDAEKPLIRRVQFHEMLTRKTFIRRRLSFMRLHYQFVMANEQRAAYDYFMIVCGPLSLMQTALAQRGATEAIAADGSLIAPVGSPARAAVP
jgi:hypothetical protein